MKLFTINKNYRYELENICRLFFPFEKIEILESDDSLDGDFYVKACAEVKAGGKLEVELKKGEFFKRAEQTLSADACADSESGLEDEAERLLAVMLYYSFCELTGSRPQWGILTGVRPGKLIRKLTASMGKDSASSYFQDKLLCSKKKTELCMTAAENEEKIIASSDVKDFSLYLSVPFCPTRCSYCSFVSHSVEKSMKLVDEYVELLCKELAYTGEMVKRLGLRLSTVYMGGGTPTTLSAEQLERVLGQVNASFDTAIAREFTVEAGRPDTITKEKLETIKAAGATRISINPQTFNDSVLQAIGRRHSTQQTVDSFKLARECGFDNINMDLIAGLPTDTVESFADSIEKALELEPESITVHTLSLKRSSRLTTGGDMPDARAGVAADKMLNISNIRLCESGYEPYYLYRQSKTVGNLENTGYAKSGFESLYNIFIMDETHSIIACGASAVTKLRSADGHIERVFNYKYPYEYISRFDELIERKKAIEEFYERYPI